MDGNESGPSCDPTGTDRYEERTQLAKSDRVMVQVLARPRYGRCRDRMRVIDDTFITPALRGSHARSTHHSGRPHSRWRPVRYGVWQYHDVTVNARFDLGR